MCKGGSRTTTSNQTSNSQSRTYGSDDSQRWANYGIENAYNNLYGDQTAPTRRIADSNAWTDQQAQEAWRIGMGERDSWDAGRTALQSAYNREITPDKIVLDEANISKYFNPYSSYVEKGLNDDLDMQNAALRSANTAAMGGVGGDRAAITEALKFEKDQLARGKLKANLWDTARNTAFGVDTSNRDAKYAADVGNRQNMYNFANAMQNRYDYSQRRMDKAADFQYNLDQRRADADYDAATGTQNNRYRSQQSYNDSLRSVLQALGMNTDTSGTQTGTQTQRTQQDALSTILGLATTAAGLYSGFGGSSLFGKGSGSGSGWSSQYGGGSDFSDWTDGGYRRGGRVNPWGRPPKKAWGGGLSFWERGEPIREAIGNRTFMPRYEEDAPMVFGSAIPDTPYSPKNFNERAQPHIDALGTGEYNPRYLPNFPSKDNDTDFRGSQPMEASNAGVIPLPRVRPDEAGPGNVGMETPTRSLNPYSFVPPREKAASTEDYDINLPEAPIYREFKKPERNWSDFLLRAGLATLAARGDTDSGGVPKGSVSNIGKGFLSALDHETKDREQARKEHETQNYDIGLGDNAKLKREQLKIQRQNAIDSAEERRLNREAMMAWRAANLERLSGNDAERKRHNQVEEARRGFIAQQRDEQLKMGKPYSDDQIVYKAQVRADNWRKDKQRLIQSGMGEMTPEQLEEGWQKVFDETKRAMLEAREQAFARQRRPVTTEP